MSGGCQPSVTARLRIVAARPERWAMRGDGGSGDDQDAFDTERPNVARMYDYFLGGAHNFAVDRAAAVAVEKAVPGLRPLARENRSFLRRAVQYLVHQGIRQFLDLGSGIPTVGNVHEIAQRA